MATYSIFSNDLKGKSFEVWLTDGLLQFVIDGEIQHDIDTVSDFLTVAAKQINAHNPTDDTIVEASGNVSANAVENYEGGAAPVFDSNGTNPSITLQDAGTEVKISGAGVGGSYRVDFGTGTTAEQEAAAFMDFANDLLGKATASPVETISGVQIGDYMRTITVTERDDDIRQIKFASTKDVKDQSWADIYIDALGADLGGTKVSNGNVSETSFTANQTFIQNDLTTVHLGPSGVGGTEKWSFASEADAIDFRNAIKSDFGSMGDRKDIINSAIETIADDLGGTQIKDGKVSVNYDAKQIRLVGDKTMVDLGSSGVGGKEQYDFDSQEAAQEFIDKVRDAVGVEATTGSLVDEFIFKVSGGAGISGSPTFVGKDAFIEYIGDEFGGTLLKDGSVSESFDGSAIKVGDGTDVKLGPKGVGGTEIWDFDSESAADAFIGTLEDLFA